MCDPDGARAEALAAELGARPLPDHRAALDSLQPDVLYLTSPPPVHREQALDALSAGCALLIEKPVALDMADVQAVGEAAQRAGKLVLVCQQHRYSQAALRARELLAGRKVGLFTPTSTASARTPTSTASARTSGATGSAPGAGGTWWRTRSTPSTWPAT